MHGLQKRKSRQRVQSVGRNSARSAFDSSYNSIPLPRYRDNNVNAAALDDTAPDPPVIQSKDSNNLSDAASDFSDGFANLRRMKNLCFPSVRSRPD